MSATVYPVEVCDRMIARYPDRIADAGGDVQFAVWLLDVDRHLARRLGGLGHRDMPDLCWADAYESGTSARQAALDAICEWHDNGDLGL
ncbi:hypothetical protein [Gordonia sihwensis]|uniref:hypothetical protein n=1 Tax=Gordonia sihwensis TaxID=173559 RepID=UPI002416DB35|nr:hypothetical protein [Gordonia sihwensis]WFN95182.1 hypothetical protein P5P27_20670 [Gordonia sihwensis]